MGRPRKPPVLLPHGGAVWFPDPRAFDREGLVAVGGDLSPARLLAAYAQGLFPWYEEGILPMWWSPDPRGLLDLEHLHVSHSLARTIRRGTFTLTWNQCFARVMGECGKGRRGGTWVIPEMLAAYDRLHRLGAAHSLECWCDGALAGGIYGVQVGALFAAESMFHRQRDASKVALVALVRSLFAAGIRLFDVQFVTAHLERLGAFQVPRVDYLRRLGDAVEAKVELRGLVPTAAAD